MEHKQKSLQEIIMSRGSVRSFSMGPIDEEKLNEILKSAIYAPYAAAATGLAITDARKVFVFKADTKSMEMVRKIIYSSTVAFAKKLTFILKIMPFLKKKMGSFSNRLNTISQNGIPSLDECSHLIIVAERKGFPDNAKQSISYAMQNMWLMSANYDIGLQLLSIIGILSNNRKMLTLLGLPKNKYQLDGCIIGTPKNKPEMKKEISIDTFVTWVS